nr:sugar phosphate isomerase/epimerase [Armatimonadota bacterium]
MAQLAVSTWSLHRELGATYRDPKEPGGAREAEYPYGEGKLTLLDLPARLVEAGLTNLEICHFHFPRTDKEYLEELRLKLKEAGVRLLTILIDAGDVTNPDPEKRTRDLEWIRGWIDVASEVGAYRVRIIAGFEEPDAAGEAVRTSIAELGELSGYAIRRGVDVITENWYALTMRPENLLAILEGLDGHVGLCADFGNYKGPTKYDYLKAILPRATSIHAKAHFTAPGEMDTEDFKRCLDLSWDAKFTGPYVLIFDQEGD